MSSDDFEVPAQSRAKIRALAYEVRRDLRIEGPYFPIVQVIEFIIPQLVDNFFLDILGEDDMATEHGAGCHAMTFPDAPSMDVRNDVYIGALADKGRDRFTLAHELGHLLMHGGQQFARRAPSANIPVYRRSEWQANTFAGELLIPALHVQQCKSIADVIELFKVSEAAAKTQWRVYKEEKIIK